MPIETQGGVGNGKRNLPSAEFRQTSVDVAPGLPDPEFRLPLGCFGLDVGPADRLMLDHLARKVVAMPGDLLAHTRRVLLAKRLEDPEETLGALVDLFIATGPRGRGLRQRLLDVCSPLLAGDRRRQLEERMATGWPADMTSPSVASLLPSGKTGSSAIVARTDGQDDRRALA